MDLKMVRKKIERKNGRKEKAKEKNIKFFFCFVIHGKFKFVFGSWEVLRKEKMLRKMNFLCLVV